MDNLTHTAVGLLLSRAGLNRWTPLAAPILMLAANAPDLDVISAAAGSIAYLNYHRHLTHALAALPLMALLPVVIVRLIARRKLRWGPALAISLIGVLSHLALDWTNIYGIRLLLPFSDRWFRGDITSVVDLWIWTVLGLALAGPFLARLVSSEIGASARGPHGRGWAIFALVFLLSYEVGRWFLHERARAVLETRLYGGAQADRVEALPSAWNPLAWRGVVETADAFSVHQLHLAGGFDPAAGTVFHKAEPGPAFEAARRSPVFHDFLRFSERPLVRVLALPQPEGAQRVEAVDMRFGTPIAPGFIATATLGPALEVLDSSFRFGAARPR